MRLGVGERAKLTSLIMHNVVVYGDSLTWGIIPNTRKRLPFDDRWPSVLESKLQDARSHVRVIEAQSSGRQEA